VLSKADGSLGRLRRCTALEKRSMIVRIVVLPSDRGRPVTKSIEMQDQVRCLMDSGCRSPAEGAV